MEGEQEPERQAMLDQRSASPSGPGVPSLHRGAGPNPPLWPPPPILIPQGQDLSPFSGHQESAHPAGKKPGVPEVQSSGPSAVQGAPHPRTERGAIGTNTGDFHFRRPGAPLGDLRRRTHKLSEPGRV